MTSTILLVISILFVLVLFLFWLGVFFIIYHLIRFGIGTQPKQYALLFLIGSCALTIVAAFCFVVSYPSIQSFANNLAAQSKITNK
jgi:hypothetical protein